MLDEPIGPNPILATRRLVAGKEDHLTEFFAAVLGVDENVREAFAGRLLAREAATDAELARPRIEGIRTQVAFSGTGCVPDLELALSDGRILLVEVKLDAPETAGEDGEGNARGQLERYLDLPVDGVAYIRTSLKSPAPSVLGHPRYMRPVSGPHFLWREVYEDLRDARSRVGVWLREAFEAWGFVPPHPMIGDLNDPDEVVRRRNRENFSKLWAATRTRVAEMGWPRTELGSKIELYVAGHPDALVKRVHINPVKDDRFVMNFFPQDGVSPERVARRVGMGVRASEEASVSVGVHRGEGAVCTVAVPLNAVVGDASTTYEIENRLAQFVAQTLAAVTVGAEYGAGERSGLGTVRQV